MTFIEQIILTIIFAGIGSIIGGLLTGSYALGAYVGIFIVSLWALYPYFFK